MAKLPEYINPLDVQREKQKITRFLHTKERSGQVRVEREHLMQDKMKKMEQKEKAQLKARKKERKEKMSELMEKTRELEDKRKRVQEERQAMEDKAVQDYRRAVRESKRRLKDELAGTAVHMTKLQAAEMMRTQSLKRDKLNSTNMNIDRTIKAETLRTLESVETRVKEHQNKAAVHRFTLSQRMGEDCRRILDQTAKHKEEQEK